MNIRELKTYQSVKFQGNQESFFSTAVRGMANIKMKVVSWGIEIETDKDHAIISFNNVAYAKPEKEESKPSAPKSK